jgi:hypothetical protein
VTETFALSMNTLNTNATALTAADVRAAALAASNPAHGNRSLYVAPPRFDAEGWIFMALLTAFTAALAMLVLAK